MTDPKAEIEAGKNLPGIPGAMWRLLEKADVREIEKWVTAERLRDTPQITMFDCVSAYVASAVLQLAGRMNRQQVRSAAQEIMIKATEMLERDIADLIKVKKSSAILRTNLHVVVRDDK